MEGTVGEDVNNGKETRKTGRQRKHSKRRSADRKTERPQSLHEKL